MGAVLGHLGVQRDSLLADSPAPIFFAELYERHYPQVLAFVSRRVSDRHVAEDLTQEAFFRALSNLADLRDGKRFYPWVRTIAYRLVVEHYEFKARVRPMAELDPGVADPPDARVLREDEHAEVRGALERVGSRYQQVLLLREQDGLSYDEIAARLGATSATVAPLLYRARAALKREYVALTEHERIAAIVPLWLGAMDMARRTRARLLQFANWFPDAQALGGSVTAVAVSVGTLLGMSDGWFRPLTDWSAESPASVLMEQAPADASGGRAGSMATTPSAPLSGQVPPVAVLPDSYRPDISTDRRTESADTEHDRRMPYFLEFGDHSLGLSPEAIERDAERSMAGDLTWMERE